MANFLGAIIGAAIDRRDGDAGLKGAIIGTVAEGAIRVLVPVATAYALVWVVQHGIRRGWRAMVGTRPTDRS
jgi:hypothetical protein